MKIDGILLEVIGNTFMSIAEEMGAVLVKSAYSTNIKERKDCSCALFDAEGHTIAQAEHIPMHLGSLLGLIGEIKKNFTPDQIHPGDMFIANDPYNGGGTHLPDIAVASPVFYEDKVVAYVANIAHHNDVGGRVPRLQCRRLRLHLRRGHPDSPGEDFPEGGSWWRTSSTSSSSTAGSTTSAGET